MITCGLIVLFGAFAQTPGPPREMPWVLPLKDTGETIHAFVDEDEWTKPLLTVRLDEPWNGPKERRIRRSSIGDDLYREPKQIRQRRIDKGWEQHGGVKVETEQGSIWVQGDEWEFARRARMLAEVSEPSGDPETEIREVGGSEVSEAVSTPTAPPGFFALWGTHLAVIVVAGALAAFVVWSLLLT